MKLLTEKALIVITVWLTWFKKLGAIPFDYEYISFLILNEYKLFLYFVIDRLKLE